MVWSLQSHKVAITEDELHTNDHLMSKIKFKNITLVLIVNVLHIYAESTSVYYLSEIDFTRLPYTFKIERTLAFNQNAYFKGQDLDNDGRDELVFFDNDSKSNPTALNYIQVDDLNSGSTRFRKNYSGILSNLNFFDLNNDKSSEIFISETRNDTVFIHAIDLNGLSLFSMPAVIRPSAAMQQLTCIVSPECAMDLNGDDWLDIVYVYHATHTYQPRGLYSFDVHNSKLLWKYSTGFVPYKIFPFDYNNDGFREILFGSSAPCNGPGQRVNGTDDCETFFTAVDSLGRTCFKNKIGDIFSDVELFMHDLDGDEKSEVLIMFRTHSQPPLSSYIALWNQEINNFAPKISMEKGLLNQIVFMDCDHNGRDDFLLCWADGTTEWRNCKLEVVNSKIFPDFYILNTVASDVNNDGEEEIFLSGLYHGHDMLVMVNRNLELLACNSREQENCGWINSTFKWSYGSEKLLIVSYPDVHYTFRIKKQIIRLTSNSSQRFFIPFMCGVIVCMCGVMLWNFLSLDKQITKNLEFLISTNQDATAGFNRKGQLIYFNSSMNHLLDHATGLKLQVHYKNLFTDAAWKEIVNWLDSSFATSQSIQKELETLDGSCSKTFMVRIFPLKLFKFKRAWIVTINEITELVQSKRTVAWASMAQRLAHEIKTPLSTVMLSAQHLGIEFENSPDILLRISKYLSHITKQVDRLSKMTDAFLKFTSIDKLQCERISVHEFIKETWQNEYAALALSVQIKFNFHPDELYIEGDRGQFTIVLKNVIDNSTQAMQGKGIITVITRTVQILRVNEKKWVQIEISDTGCGMTHEQQMKLFQPFNSLKEGGTGLGMVIAQKIIQDHQGRLKIESEAGIGTSVFIDLPLASI